MTWWMIWLYCLSINISDLSRNYRHHYITLPAADMMINMFSGLHRTSSPTFSYMKNNKQFNPRYY